MNFKESDKSAKSYLQESYYDKQVAETEYQRKEFEDLGFKIEIDQEHGNTFYITDPKSNDKLRVAKSYKGEYNFAPAVFPSDMDIYRKIQKDFDRPRNVKKPRYNAVKNWFIYYRNLQNAYDAFSLDANEKRREFDKVVEELKKTSEKAIQDSRDSNKWTFYKKPYRLELEFSPSSQTWFERLIFNSFEVTNKVDFFKKIK